MTRRDRGTTVTQLLVVLAIVSAALGVAAGLMAEAQRRALVETSRVLDMPVPVAVRQLKADVMAAADVAPATCIQPEPIKSSMVLLWPGGRRVTYELSGGHLLRKLDDPPGERMVLDSVRGFRWKCSPGTKTLLWIELTYESARLGGPEVEQGRRLFVRREAESQVFEIALRGAGGRRW